MRIFKETVSDLLWDILNRLMVFKELATFRLVGGTSLSLLLGHRVSDDIDLFSDAAYNSINFEIIDKLLQDNFGYVSFSFGGNNSMGKSYFIGNNENETVKLDLFYTDKFIFPIVEYQGLRLSKPEEIAAMKLEVIGHNGRKKDFWDLHELMEYFSIEEMLNFYKQRYPYGHSRERIISKLTDFEVADLDLNPICIKGKYWELIRLDIEEEVEKNFG